MASGDGIPVHHPHDILELEPMNVDVAGSKKEHSASLLERRGRPLAKLQLTRSTSNASLWHRVREIGNDAEGRCDLVRRPRDQQLRVVKTVMNPRIAHGRPIEAAILRNTFPRGHENIIRLEAYQYFEDARHLPGVRYWLEYCDGGDLKQLINIYRDHDALIPELFIWKCFQQIAEAIEFLHRGFDNNRGNPERLGVVHRDIKPENIFMRLQEYPEYPDVVLGDFGAATYDFASYEPAGTYAYQPPEIPRKSPKGDVYSLGVVIHELIHDQLPLIGLPDWVAATERNISLWESCPEARQAITEVPKAYSEGLVLLMLIALDPDHNRRKTSGQLLRMLCNCIEEMFPPTADLYGNVVFQPLAEWAFQKAENVEEKEEDQITYGNGCGQYFDMMAKAGYGNLTDSPTSLAPRSASSLGSTY